MKKYYKYFKVKQGNGFELDPELEWMSNDLVKVVIIGNSRVGKTNLLNVLYGEGYKEESISTHGVQYHSIKSNRKTFFIQDFGGQDIYLGTHLLSIRAADIIIYCWTNEKNLEHETVFNQRLSHKGWGFVLQNIHLLHDNKYLIDQRGGKQIKFISVFTQGETKGNKAFYERRQRRSRVLFDLCISSSKNVFTIDPELWEEFFVSAKTNLGIESLREYLDSVATEICKIGVIHRPVKKLRAHLVDLSSNKAYSNRKFLKYEEFVKLCEDFGCSTEEQFLEHLIDYLDDRGFIFKLDRSLDSEGTVNEEDNPDISVNCGWHTLPFYNLISHSMLNPSSNGYYPIQEFILDEYNDIPSNPNSYLLLEKLNLISVLNVSNHKIRLFNPYLWLNQNKPELKPFFSFNKKEFIGIEIEVVSELRYIYFTFINLVFQSSKEKIVDREKFISIGEYESMLSFHISPEKKGFNFQKVFIVKDQQIGYDKISILLDYHGERKQAYRLIAEQFLTSIYKKLFNYYRDVLENRSIQDGFKLVHISDGEVLYMNNCHSSLTGLNNGKANFFIYLLKNRVTKKHERILPIFEKALVFKVEKIRERNRIRVIQIDDHKNYLDSDIDSMAKLELKIIELMPNKFTKVNQTFILNNQIFHKPDRGDEIEIKWRTISNLLIGSKERELIENYLEKEQSKLSNETNSYKELK